MSFVSVGFNLVSEDDVDGLVQDCGNSIANTLGYHSFVLSHHWVSFLNSKYDLYSDFTITVIYAVWSYNSQCPCEIRRYCWSVCMYTYDYCHDWSANVQDIIANLYTYLLWVEKKTAMCHGILNNNNSVVCSTACSGLYQRNIKIQYHLPLCEGFNGDWWIPLTNGQ